MDNNGEVVSKVSNSKKLLHAFFNNTRFWILALI